MLDARTNQTEKVNAVFISTNNLDFVAGERIACKARETMVPLNHWHDAQAIVAPRLDAMQWQLCMSSNTVSSELCCLALAGALTTTIHCLTHVGRSSLGLCG